MNRLASASSTATSGTDCWGESYGYDRYGNLLSINVTQCTAESLNLAVNSNNQITNAGFSYDSSGNITSDGTTTYSWDAENRPKAAGTTTYAYDGDNWRTQKSTGELYWYDVACTHDILDETDSAGNITNEYI